MSLELKVLLMAMQMWLMCYYRLGVLYTENMG